MEKEKYGKRHKCSICGSVRYEKYLKKLNTFSRFRNRCWCCVDNPDCLQKSYWFISY